MSAQLVVIVMPVKTPCCAIAVGPITPIPVACQTIGCPVCVVQFMAAPVWVVHEAVTGEDTVYWLPAFCVSLSIVTTTLGLAGL